MDVVTGLVGIVIVVVAIVGAFAYAAWERWREGEEKKQALASAAGSELTQHRVDRIEQDIAMLRVEVGDDLRDVKEQLMRIEKLLRDVG